MVFESVVADVLNRFLGDYVENLDGSQLKLGIWGGEQLDSHAFIGRQFGPISPMLIYVHTCLEFDACLEFFFLEFAQVYTKQWKSVIL